MKYQFKISALFVIPLLAFISVLGCTSKYDVARSAAQDIPAIGNNPSEDSLGVRRPDSEYFKTWEGGKWQLNGAHFIPAEMYDSLAKVDPDFMKFLEFRETQKKHRENNPDNPGDNPLNDSLGVVRPASAYFPKVWDGGDVPSDFWYTVPPELQDSMAKINPMFKKYLEFKKEAQKKHLENEANSSDSTATDTTATH